MSSRFGLLRYTLVRLALLAVVAGVLWLVGIREPLVLLALAIVVSGIISLLLLNRTRDDASASVSGFFQRINQRIDESAAAEDEMPPAPADSAPRPDDQP